MKRIIIQKRVILLIGLFLAIMNSGWARAEEPFFQIAFPHQDIRVVTVAAHTPQVIYIKNGEEFMTTGDFGATWRTLSIDRNTRIEWLQLNPMNSSIIYAGDETGFHCTLDVGDTWQKRSDRVFNTCLIYPLKPETLFGRRGNELYRSLDAGSTWNLFLSEFCGFSIQASYPNAFYYYDIWGDTFPLHFDEAYSLDEGKNWIPLGYTEPPSYDLSDSTFFIDFFPNYICWGEYVSLDLGKTWMSSGLGLGNAKVCCLATDPNRPASIFAGTTNGLYWKPIINGNWEYVGLGDMTVSSLAFDTLGSIIYAGTSDGLWSSKPMIDRMTPRITVLTPANGDTVFGRVEISVKAEGYRSIKGMEIRIDDERVASLSGNQGQTQDFSWSWDTRTNPWGMHSVDVKVVDSSGNRDVAIIPVKVENIACSLSAERVAGRSWLMRRSGVKLVIRVDNRGQVSGVTYSLRRRRKGETEWTTIMHFTEAQLQNGSYVYFDKVPMTSLKYEYKIEAKADDVLQGASEKIVIQ